MRRATLWELFLLAVGNVGRYLYEWADRKLEAGDAEVVRHARLRFNTGVMRNNERTAMKKKWYTNGDA